MEFSLDAVEHYLHTQVAPIAEQLDTDAEALRQVFLELGRQNWLALRVNQSWGGADIGDRGFQQFQELLARYSGALAFLQAQHQSAGALLNHSANLALKQQYLPGMATGGKAIGVGFSHLRRSGEPPVKAVPHEGGYLIDGTIPWITGCGVFQAFIGAAVLPDQQAVYGVFPFVDTQQSTGGTLVVGEPMPLAALTATSTVAVTLKGWFLPEAQVAAVKPANAIHKSDVLNVLQHSFFALGCAQAGLDVVHQTAQRRSQPFLQNAYTVLAEELQNCRQLIYAAESHTFESRLQLRAWAIDLAVRCAHAAVVVSAGAANAMSHPAQRIFREAMVFSVTGQTSAVMEVTLAQLLRSPNRKTLPQMHISA